MTYTDHDNIAADKSYKEAFGQVWNTNSKYITNNPNKPTVLIEFNFGYVMVTFFKIFHVFIAAITRMMMHDISKRPIHP